MKTILEKTLNEYLTNKALPLSNNEFAKFFTKKTKGIIIECNKINTEEYILNSSVGKGLGLKFLGLEFLIKI